MLDPLVRHSVYVQRFAGSQLREMLGYLLRVESRVVNILKGSLTESNRTRYLLQLDSLRARILEVYQEMGTRLEGSLREFAKYEAEFSTRVFNRNTKDQAVFAVPSDEQIIAAVFLDPIRASEQNIGRTIEKFGIAKADQIITTVKDGIILGKTNEELTSEIKFISRRIQRNHARALATTLTNQVSNAARQVVLSENSDLIESVEWVSTLDGSTTHSCQALDGQYFDINSGPRPPLHWGCRSTVVPRVKQEYRLSVPQERPAMGPETVSGRTTYNSWLKRQPKEFQDEVLGPQRGKLFREGGYSVRDFVDQNYRPLTLDELKIINPL